jgi:flagellar hook assembly protein FlgD
VVNENGGVGSYSLAVAGLPLVGVPGEHGAFRTALGAIRPNPIRTRATIAWTLARPAPVAIEIVHVAGRVVARVDAGTQGVGPGSLAWDGRGAQGARLGAGVYFAHLVVDGVSIGAARLVLLR